MGSTLAAPASMRIARCPLVPAPLWPNVTEPGLLRSAASTSASVANLLSAGTTITLWSSTTRAIRRISSMLYWVFRVSGMKL